MFQGLWLSLTSGKRLGNLVAIARKDGLLIVKEMLDTGRIRPVVERTYHLNELPEATRRIENEHARGKIVNRMWS